MDLNRNLVREIRIIRCLRWYMSMLQKESVTHLLLAIYNLLEYNIIGKIWTSNLRRKSDSTVLQLCKLLFCNFASCRTTRVRLSRLKITWFLTTSWQLSNRFTSTGQSDPRGLGGGDFSCRKVSLELETPPLTFLEFLISQLFLYLLLICTFVIEVVKKVKELCRLVKKFAIGHSTDCSNVSTS